MTGSGKEACVGRNHGILWFSTTIKYPYTVINIVCNDQYQLQEINVGAWETY
jgi:hypothetical protein